MYSTLSWLCVTSLFLMYNHHKVIPCVDWERECLSHTFTSSHFQVPFGVSLFLFDVTISFCAFFCSLLFLYLSLFVFIPLSLVFLTNMFPINLVGARWHTLTFPGLSVCFIHVQFDLFSLYIIMVLFSITDAFHQPITFIWGFYFVLTQIKINWNSGNQTALFC